AAMSHLKAVQPTLIAIGGLSGTGKSTLSAAIAHLVGTPPGALHVRSDVERKRLFQVAETQRLSPAGYDQASTARVYQELTEKARLGLRAGRGVIVDAVFSKPAERKAIEQLALEEGCRFKGIWLSAPADLLIGRVAARRNDASDANESVVRQQLNYDIGELPWARVDATGAP